MDYALVLFRLLHILGGVIWVGMVFFTVIFLGPAVQDAGPEGGKVMGALQKRGVMNVIPAVALATVLSGLWLYWRASLGFDPAWVHSRLGMTLSLGGFAAIVAYVIGLTVMRPSMLAAMRIMQSLGGAAEAERAQGMAEAQRLRTRGRKAGLAVLWLLLLSTAAMAVARYL